MKSVRLVLAFLALVLAAACYPPVTTHPVGTTTGLRNDPALLGTWISAPSSDEKPSTFRFMLGSAGTMRVRVEPNKGAKDDEPLDAVISTAWVRGTRFINVELVGTKPEDRSPPGTTIPILYRIDALGTLTLYFLDEKATKDAIRAGQLKGDAGKDETGDARITEEPRALDAYLSSPQGLALFDKPFVTLHKRE